MLKKSYARRQLRLNMVERIGIRKRDPREVHSNQRTRLKRLAWIRWRISLSSKKNLMNIPNSSRIKRNIKAKTLFSQDIRLNKILTFHRDHIKIQRKRKSKTILIMLKAKVYHIVMKIWTLEVEVNSISKRKLTWLLLSRLMEIP